MRYDGEAYITIPDLIGGGKMEEKFHKIAARVANILGSPYAFVAATGIVVLWALTGPLFDFSNTWQLFINTGTTVATFLMVFLIQNTQNRDAKAIHIKLDELVKATKAARNQVVGVEELSEKELDQLLGEFREIHDKYEREITRRGAKLELLSKRDSPGKVSQK